MIAERELWACAHQVLQQYGDGAVAMVAARIADLAQKGDARGVAAWQAIAARMDALRAGADTVLH